MRATAEVHARPDAGRAMLCAMAELVLHHTFRAPIDRVWARIDDHAGMSAWIGAPVRVRGDGAVGTVRTVGAGFTFDETIVEREPPHRLVYRITRGVPVTHRGEIALTERAPGTTELRWTIAMTSRIPFFVPVLVRVLRFSLTRALATLARLVEAA
jgi:uncharacterized protein YndB with AHSA1/START domain